MKGIDDGVGKNYRDTTRTLMYLIRNQKMWLYSDVEYLKKIDSVSFFSIKKTHFCLLFSIHV